MTTGTPEPRRVGVLVVGDIVTDIVAAHTAAIAVGSDTGAAISITGGGSAANAAAWLASAGLPVDLVGVVGNDAAGAQRVDELLTAGVGCRFVRRTDSAATGSIIVLVHAGERSFLRDRGANLHLAPSDVDDAVNVSAAGHLHLSGYPLLDNGSRPAGLRALRAARDKGMSSSVDAASAAPLRRAPGFREWIRGVDIVFANLDEARVLTCDEHPTGSLAAHAIPRGSPLAPEVLADRLRDIARNIVIKLGPDGAIWAGRHGLVSAAALPATIIDSTGAGDAFAAGFLSAWLAGAEPAAVLQRAVAFGTAAVETTGGRPVSPRRA